MKRKSRSFSPHNFRKKTARFFKKWQSSFFLLLNQGLKLAVLFSFLLFLFLNLHSAVFPENEKLKKARKEVLNFPLEPQAHTNLARVYLEMGDLEEVRKEISLAKSLASTTSSILKGVENLYKKAKERPQKIRGEIAFWEKIIQEKPDYRDAYFQLAILNYQIDQIQKAKKYLHQTLKLDPNFEPAKKLEKLLRD